MALLGARGAANGSFMTLDELLAALAHDHVGTTALLDESAEVLRAWRAKPDSEAATRERLIEPLVALRDHLIDHFAAEEEALAELARFSSVEMRRAIEALEHEHARICALAVRLGDWAERDASAGHGTLGAIASTFDELARRHAEHEPSEHALLAALREAARPSPTSTTDR